MNGFPSYLNPLDQATIKRGLIDDRLQQVNLLCDKLKTAPASITDAQITELLLQMAADFESQLRQILESR